MEDKNIVRNLTKPWSVRDIDRILNKTLQTRIQVIKDELKYTNFSYHIDYENRMGFSLTLNHREEMFKHTCKFWEIEDIRGWLDEVIAAFKDYLVEYKVLHDKHKLILSEKKPKPGEFKYIGFTTGKCKYANLGYTRYVWFGVTARNSHTQYMRLFFNRDDILFQKTKDELAKDINTMSPSCDEADPPNVSLIFMNYINIVFDFIKANGTEIFQKVSALPLNKSIFAENKEFSLILMRKEGKTLHLITKDELCDPNLDLYVFLAFDMGNGNRKIFGYCKSVNNPKDKIYIVRDDEKYNNTYDFDKATVLGDPNNLHSIHKTYRIDEALSDNDEFVNWVFETHIKAWREKEDGTQKVEK